MFRAGLFAAAFAGACASGGSGSVDAGIDSPPLPDATIDSSVDSCLSTDTCTTTNLLGSVSGDTDGQNVMTTGYRAAWLRVRVTEDNSSSGGKKLRLAARLTSPANVAFDVFTYVNAGSDVLECSTMVGMSTTSGSVDEVRLEWGEGGIANGVDDDRDVSIEIRPASSGCTTSELWSLELEGNWN